MRLASFTADGRRCWGPVTDDGSVFNVVSGDGTLVQALTAGGVQHAVDGALIPHARQKVTLLPPVTDPQKILCVGLNYADHVAEMHRDTPAYPVIFTRFPDTLVGDADAIRRPRVSARLDYEGEFCIVIGTRARHVPPDRALEHVFGYTIMNDGSVRDFQRHTPQYTPGKNFPQSGALGPVVVTVDEFGPVAGQRIRTRVNGVVRQESSLDQLIFDVPHLVSYCSSWTALNPGDLIATGTPSGVGGGQTPPRWLEPGDVVEISIDGIGTLTNSVAQEE